MYLVLAVAKKDLFNALRSPKHIQDVSYLEKEKKLLQQRTLRNGKNIKKYLNPITTETTQDDDIEFGMLIGTNCVKALELVEIIASQDGEPYIYKTKLGW